MVLTIIFTLCSCGEEQVETQSITGIDFTIPEGFKFYEGNTNTFPENSENSSSTQTVILKNEDCEITIMSNTLPSTEEYGCPAEVKNYRKELKTFEKEVSYKDGTITKISVADTKGKEYLYMGETTEYDTVIFQLSGLVPTCVGNTCLLQVLPSGTDLINPHVCGEDFNLRI